MTPILNIYFTKECQGAMTLLTEHLAREKKAVQDSWFTRSNPADSAADLLSIEANTFKKEKNVIEVASFLSKQLNLPAELKPHNITSLEIIT